MRTTRALWKNLALSAIALFVSVGVGELVVRSFVPVRNVGPSFTIYDPFYGKRLKKNFSARRITPEFTMRITTNSDGFRGPELGSLPLRPILFLGDSFTMGYGVNDGEEFPALVRNAIDSSNPETVAVINAGMGDNGNGRWIKFLRSEGKRYNPGLVVLQIHANDFQDNIRERLFKLTPTGELRELPVPSPGVKRILTGLVESIPGLAHSYLIGLARQVIWDRRSPHRGSDSKTSSTKNDKALLEKELMFRLLEEVLILCKEKGQHVLVILVGTSNMHLVELEKFLLVRDIPTVVIPGKPERPDLYYKVDGHWNAAGHKFTADRILEGIEKFDLKYW